MLFFINHPISSSNRGINFQLVFVILNGVTLLQGLPLFSSQKSSGILYLPSCFTGRSRETSDSNRFLEVRPFSGTGTEPLSPKSPKSPKRAGNAVLDVLVCGGLPQLDHLGPRKKFLSPKGEEDNPTKFGKPPVSPKTQPKKKDPSKFTISDAIAEGWDEPQNLKTTIASSMRLKVYTLLHRIWFSLRWMAMAKRPRLKDQRPGLDLVNSKSTEGNLNPSEEAVIDHFSPIHNLVCGHDMEEIREKLCSSRFSKPSPQPEINYFSFFDDEDIKDEKKIESDNVTTKKG